MMIDEHHIRLLRFLARLHDETVLLVLALGAQTGISGGGDQIPYLRRIRDFRQFGLVAARSRLGKARFLAQIADIFARSQPADLQGALKMEMVYIFGAALL